MKLENKTVEELKNMCRNKKISGYSKLNKQGLINLLNNNKKGGYVVKNWMKAFSNNYIKSNGTTKITKNNLAYNYYNVFVPIKKYNLDEIHKNNINYSIINKMIFDYLIEQEKEKKNNNKISKLKKYIKEYVPINNGSTKINKKSVCKWLYLDNNLNLKEIYGKYIDHGYYQPKHKSNLPPSFKDYDGFLIVESSSYI